MMCWTWILLGIFALVFLLQAFPWKRNAQAKRLPPGPRGFPIFGCLHLLGKYPHRDLQKLAQKYGSIVFLRLGLKPTVVVSSPQAAELFLRTHDLNFANRPPIETSNYISHNQKGVVFAPYGSYWRTIRKMYTLELLSNQKINSFKSMRKEELDLLIECIKEAACSGAAVDLSAKVGSVTANMTCRMVFRKKYMEEEFGERSFKDVFQEVMELLATPNLTDYIPPIASLDLQGLRKRAKSVAKVMDLFLDKVIDEHVQSKDDDSRTRDFVDLMLSFMESEGTELQINREHIKAIILEVLGAAMDTSAAAIEWGLSELIKCPRVMKKVQKELETVVGKDRLVEESDLGNLEYLDMVVKETLRLHPSAPLLNHASREDCTVNGFHIPKESRVFINVWAIGRDPGCWKDPDEFFPERFMGSNIDLVGHDFQLIPFGSGRRNCPGMQLGLTVVRLVLAQLVHCFDWELPEGTVRYELDMTEHFGLVTSRAKHLLAVPTYRFG